MLGRSHSDCALWLQELQQERQAKRKLERMVCSLMQEVERLREVTSPFREPYVTAEWRTQCQKENLT